MSALPQHLLTLQNSPIPDGSIEKMYGLMLYGAMRNEHPQNVLEIGTGQGYSTAWMLLGLEENDSGHLYSVDVNTFTNKLWRDIQLPDSRLHLLENETVESSLDQIPSELDFIFHDGGHSLDEIKSDLAMLLPRLKLHGSIVIHDVIYSREMGQFVFEFFDSKSDEFSFQFIEEGCGVCIARRISKVEVTSCKDESNGSTMAKDLDSSQEMMAKTTLRITPKSKWRATKPSKKIKKSTLKARKKKKVFVPTKSMVSNGLH